MFRIASRPVARRVSVTRQLSWTMGGLIVALLLLLVALGYGAMSWAASRLAPILARQTAELRAEAGAAIFLQAQNSVLRLQEELLLRLEQQDPGEARRRFDALFAPGWDGLWRLRREWVDTESAPTMYLRPGARGPSDSARLRAVVSYQLLREQGPALVPPFFSAYMDFVEDGLMVYARGRDWGGAARADASNAHYPTMIGSRPENNPQRRLFWTPVYFDQQAQAWLVSVIQPLDWRGAWVGTVGHDIAVQTLLDAVRARSAEGGLQMILSADGQLIAHPELQNPIVQADGQLAVHQLGDPLLAKVQALIAAEEARGGATSGARRIGATDGADGHEAYWVAWSRIKGPDWCWVQLLPQSQVDLVLRWGAAVAFLIGLLGLLPALWIMRVLIRRIVSRPLQRLTVAVDELGQGLMPAPIALSGADELGRLARAFDGMVLELRAGEAARRRYLTRLEEEHARLLALLGAMDLGILFVTADNQIQYCNGTFLRIWQMDESANLVGRPAGEVLSDSAVEIVQPTHFSSHLHELLGTREASASYEIATGDGRVIVQTAYPVRDAEGRFIGQLWIHADVTRERQTAEQLVYLAERDALTGLYNRRRFEDELGRFIQESQRRQRHGALLFFDLDEFKHINDTFGHRAGDAVLIRVASEVGALTRRNELLCRLGGDEFAVLMPDARQEEAEHLAERIVRAIALIPFRIDGQNLRLTSSLGIALYSQGSLSAEELVAHADTAMYQAKESGKNAWKLYLPGRDTSRKMITRLGWNDRIARALEQGLFRLHYQGVYHAGDGAISHLEVLIRMVDLDDATQLVMPGQFIPYAEKSGKIVDIDRWVIRASVEQLAANPAMPPLAVNISGRSFDQTSFPHYIAEMLSMHGVEPRRLLVELTETSAVSDLQDAECFIAALRQTGCQTCLDDFGAGFASFAYLKHLKVDLLKIDGLFIRDLPKDSDNQVFVRAIVDVARALGKRTVAEFVEDEQTLAMVCALGVDLVQGYHLDRPQADHPALARAPQAQSASDPV
jgi:diguanylate cyclase (GGDEF)-like protein